MICNGLLKIGQPRLEDLGNGWTRLVSDIDIGGELKQVWLSVEDKYAQYLCHERSDAFLVGLFPIAYRRHLNVQCEAPVSEYLLFQLRSYLIPLISKYGRSVWPVSIDAEVVSSTIPNAGGVGTGISCGIDSLHAILNHMNPIYPDLKLTHLVLNNVGAFGETGGDIKGQFEWTINHARRFCDEYGYELIVINSNLFEGMGLDFENNSTYMNMFPILALQKLWRSFIYASSGYDFQRAYTLINNDDRDPCHYDMLLLDCVSNPNLKIYNEGAPYSRYEKTRHLIDFEPARKYLQVCIDGSGGNCGKCTKCRRTLLTLDALGALDKFDKVFDVEYYKRNRGEYLRHLYRMHLTPGDHMLGEVYDILKKDVSLGCRILGAWDYYYNICLCCVKDALRPTFKKLGLLKR